MAIISNGKAEPALAGAGAEVVVTWATDVSADSTVVWGQGGTELGTLQDGSPVTSHSMTIAGLVAGADYWVRPSSLTERGQPCSYDPATMPADGKIGFRTPLASGPADEISVGGVPTDHVAKGTPVTIAVEAWANGAAAASRTVSFRIQNGQDRGTFSANPASTGPDGKVSVAFTPSKNGKAQIQVLVDTVSQNLDIIVN